MLVLIVIAYLIPIFSYFLAHEMRNRKYLIIYSIFWLTVIGFAIYDLKVAGNLPDGDDDLSLGWVIVASIIYGSCYMAVIGIIGRAAILYFRHKGKELKSSTIHLVSFGSVFVLPTLIQILLVFIRLIFG